MSRPSDGSRSVSGALSAAGRLLRDRPAVVLPAYLLAVGLTGAARVPVLVGLAVAVGSLAVTGRLERLVRAGVELQEAVRETDATGAGGLGGAGGGQGVPDPAVDAFGDAVANAVTPTVVAAVGLGVVGAFVVGYLARAVAAAVTYGTVWAGLDGRRPLVSGVRAAGRWRTFLGIALVRSVVTLVALGLPLFVGLNLAVSPVVLAQQDASAAAALAVLLVVALTGLGVVVVLVAAFLLVFAESAAVVDDRGAWGSIRASLGFVRRQPGQSVGFALVAVGAYVAVAVGVGVANAAGAGSLGGIVLPLLVAPFLDAGATALYAGVDDADGAAATDATDDDRPGVADRLRRGLALGWAELRGFLRSHPLSVMAALGLLTGGIAAGYALTAPYGLAAAGPTDVAGVFGAVAVGPFVTIAANNWLVSVGLAYGGVAFGLPAVSGLVFNGVLVGALAGVFDRTAFLALVAPHGVLELPVIAVAGGLGLHLGGVGWRAVRGRADAETVAGELERAAWVLVGIGILLVVASAIEAFLTPRIAAAVLGG
ncbi:stage II sporulation protein M [Halobaculum marinum]|uniref:Stage II sporulation protein M n=1 Tax=Halobaculum marinum TaxID=3031996 RepID=A0ABD5WUD1_9EURY|nr:stage II sporulation protein M [Halobaculum sp. DT55]